MSADSPQLDQYKLEDRYLREAGRVFLTGTQALVRIPLMQAALDRKQGLNTAGLVSGYRGSPSALTIRRSGRPNPCSMTTASTSSRLLTKTWPPPSCSAPSRWKLTMTDR